MFSLVFFQKHELKCNKQLVFLQMFLLKITIFKVSASINKAY